MTPGLYLLHKPIGPTSFSLVQACIESARLVQAWEGRSGRVRICHGGTLDPFASGLLLILAGRATRLFEHLHGVPKIYEATVRWGVETDNGDPLGRPTFTGDPSTLSPELLDNALATFVGWHDQVPPATSNKRIEGERAYLKAHRGEAVNLPASRVYLHEARWLAHDGFDGFGPRDSRLRLIVRGGYYIRALVRDLGRRLGCGAHLTALRRTSIGPWNDPGRDRRIELHGREIAPWMPTRMLSDQDVGELRQNRTIATGELLAADWTLPPGFPEPEPLVRGFHRDDFVFLLRREDQRLRVVSAFPGGI